MTTSQQITRIIRNRQAQGFSPAAIAHQIEKELAMNNPIYDTREYYDPYLNATIRANILGGGIDESGVYLVVQPTAALLSQQWHEMPTDDTAFKEAADVVMREGQS